MNLNQVTLPALDIAASAAFYRRMGFTQIVDAPHCARFECPAADATFSLHRASHAIEATGATLHSKDPQPDALVAGLLADLRSPVPGAIPHPCKIQDNRSR